MSKSKYRLKLVAYDEEGIEFGSTWLEASSRDQIYHEFLVAVEFLLKGQFSRVRGISLVSGGHVLFMFRDVRKIVKQFNKSILIQ